MAERMSDEPSEPAARWNYVWLIMCWIVGFVAQMIYLPCLCAEGQAKVSVALVFDVLVLVRVLLALRRDERGRGWVLYAALCVASPLWIEVAARLAL